MKKFTLILSILLICNNLFCQYNYFQWNKTSTDVTGRSISSNSSIAIDQYNRVFYIDRSSKKICWVYGIVKDGAPLARSNSNLIYKYDNYGNYIFYIGQDNKIKCIQYLYSQSLLGWTVYEYPSGTVANGSFIEYGISNDEIFYINASDNKVSCYWKNNSGWGIGPLNSLALPAQSWSNLVFSDNSVFYIANNGKIAGLAWNNSTNTWDILSLSSSSVALNSRIFAFDRNNILYVQASDNRIGQYWKNSSGSGFGTFVNNSTPVMSMSPIISRFWNDINYIGIDGNIHCLYYDYSRADDFVLNSTCNISSPYLTESSDGSFFFYSNSNFYSIKSPVLSGFVYRKGSKLFLDNGLYRPFIVNYLASIYTLDGNTFFAGPCGHYSDDWRTYLFNDEQSCNALFEQHLQQISQLGFKAIRFNGLNVCCNLKDENDADIYIEYINQFQWPQVSHKLDDSMINKLFITYDKVLALCDKYGLKVNFFIGLADGGASKTICYKNYTNYLTKLAQRYANDNRIFCYSVLLEPDVFNTVNCKTYIASQTQMFYNALRQNDPNHLITIGLSTDAQSQLNWDPSILAADFFTFHLYPTTSELADPTFEIKKQQIKWIYNAMKKLDMPWIIGETSMPGNSPVYENTASYDMQRNYGLFMRDNVFASGASGLTWWNYRDVYWPGPNLNEGLQNKYGQNTRWDNFSDYSGLITHNGGLKPIVANGTNIFNNFTPTISDSCSVTPFDYYHQNILNPTFTISGKITDANGKAITDAYIWGVEVYSDGSWHRNTNTLSDNNGNYILKTSHPVNVLLISALGKAIYQTWSLSNGEILNQTLGNINCETPVNSFTKIGTNVGEANHWTLEGNCDGPDVAYLFTVMSTTTIRASTCDTGTDFDTKLEIFKSDGTPVPNAYNDNDNNCSNYSHASTVIVTLTPGDYYAVVDGYCGSTGKFELHIDQYTNLTKSAIENNSSNFIDKIENIKESGILIFPNPSKGQINFKSEDKIIEIVITDIQGKIIKQVRPEIPDSAITLDLSSMSDKIYIAKIITLSGTSNRKIILLK